MKYLVRCIFLYFFPALLFAETDLRTDTRTIVFDSVAKDRKNWGLSFGAGTGITRGNSDTTAIKLDLGAFKKHGDFDSYFLTNYNFASTEIKKTINNGGIVLRQDYHLNDDWRLFWFNTHSYNEFQKIDYRGTLGAGPWYDVHIAKKVDSGLSIAFVYEYETTKILPSEETVRLSFRNLLSARIEDSTLLGSDFFYTPSLEDFSDFQLFASLFIRTSIWKDILGLRNEVAFNRDNLPKTGVEKNDLSISASLTYQIGE